MLSNKHKILVFRTEPDPKVPLHTISMQYLAITRWPSFITSFLVAIEP